MAENIKNAYHVSLGGDSVPNAAKRSRINRNMTIYLIICGLLMVEGGWRIFSGYLDVTKAKKDSALIQRDFKAAHPGESSLSTFAGVMKAKLEAQSTTFSQLNKNLPSSVPAMELMYELMAVAPERSELMSYTIASDEEGVTWQCRVVQYEEMEISPDELVKEWRQNEKIAEYVENIMMINLEDNLFVNGIPANIITCRGKLKVRKK